MLHELDDMVLLRESRPFLPHTSRQIMRMLGLATTAGANTSSIEEIGSRE